MPSVRKIRSIIKKEFPDLTFILRTISFSDLARDEKVFLESTQWGMCQGNSELFREVKSFCKQFDNVIVSF